MAEPPTATPGEPIGVERLAAALPPVAVAAVAAAAVVAQGALHAGAVPAVAAGLAVAVAGAAIALLVPRLARRLPQALAGAARRRPRLACAWGAVAVLAVVNTARLGVFMVDGSQVWASMFPPVPESAEHQCLAAYVRAGELVAGGV